MRAAVELNTRITGRGESAAPGSMPATGPGVPAAPAVPVQGIQEWTGRTLEIGRDEVWVAYLKSSGQVLPVPGTQLLLRIELPPHEQAQARCMHCEGKLLDIAALDESRLRLRFRVLSMDIRPCEASAAPAAVSIADAIRRKAVM